MDNSVPPTVTSSPTVNSFKRRLKTHLFHCFFPSWLSAQTITITVTVSLQFFNLRHVKNIIFSYNNKGKAQDKAIQDKIDDLIRAVERLKHLQAHDALVILKNSLAVPMLLYQETFEDPFIPLFLPFVTFSSDHHRRPGSNRHCVLEFFYNLRHVKNVIFSYNNNNGLLRHGCLCHPSAWLFCEGGGIRFIPAWFLYFFVLHSVIFFIPWELSTRVKQKIIIIK